MSTLVQRLAARRQQRAVAVGSYVAAHGGDTPFLPIRPGIAPSNPSLPNFAPHVAGKGDPLKTVPGGVQCPDGTTCTPGSACIPLPPTHAGEIGYKCGPPQAPERGPKLRVDTDLGPIVIDMSGDYGREALKEGWRSPEGHTLKEDQFWHPWRHPPPNAIATSAQVMASSTTGAREVSQLYTGGGLRGRSGRSPSGIPLFRVGSRRLRRSHRKLRRSTG